MKEVLYWHKAGSGIQEVFNRMHVSGKKHLNQMDTETIEVWTTTILALAMQHSEDKIFWLGKPKNDPPDMVFMTITQNGFFHVRELEVTRCRHPSHEVITNILKKDKENNFPENYILCGFVEVPGEYDLLTIAEDLQTRLINIKNVVFVFNGIWLSERVDTFDEATVKNFWTIVQVAPIFDAVTLDISIEYKKWLEDPDKLRYTMNHQIYAGKRNKNDPYPRLLFDTPISF